MVKWWSSVVRTYLYSAFDCMILSYHLFITEWIHTLCRHLARSRHKAWTLIGWNWIRAHIQLNHKWTLKYLVKLVKWLSCVVKTCLYGAFDCMFASFHIPFQRESTLFTCLNIKKLFAKRRRKISSLSDCNWTRSLYHLHHRQTPNDSPKLASWLSFFVSTYKHGVFDCMFLSCHVRASEWIHTLCLPEWQETPCWKQAQSLKFNWLQLYLNPQPISS